MNRGIIEEILHQKGILSEKEYLEKVENLLREIAGTMHVFSNDFDLLKDIVIIVEQKNLAIAYLNKSAENFFSVRRDRIIGLHYSTLHSLENFPQVKPHNSDEDEIISDIAISDIITKDGNKKTVEVNFQEIKRNKKNYFVALYREITERVKLENTKQSLLDMHLNKSNFSSQELLQEGIQKCIYYTNSRGGFFGELDEFSQKCKLVFSEGLPDDTSELIVEHILTDLCKKNILKKGKVYKSNVLANRDIKRFLLYPIFKDENIIAVLGIFNKVEDYDWHDVDLFTILSEDTWVLFTKKEYEVRLSENTKLIEHALESRSDGVWEWNIAKKEIKCNVQCAKMLGYDYYVMPKTVRAFLRLFHFADIKKVKPILARAIQKKTGHFSVSFRIKAASEVWLWMEINGKVIEYDNNRNPIKAVGTLTDITEIRLSEILVKESEDRYKFLSQLTSEGIFLHKEGVLIDCNESFLDLIGYERSEVIDKSIIDVLSFETDAQKTKRILLEMPSGMYPLTLVNKKGELIHVEFEHKKALYRGEEVKVAAFRNIEERIRVENALLESESQHKMVSSILSDFVYSFDCFDNSSITINWVNGSFKEFTGYTVEEVNNLENGWFSVVDKHDLMRVLDQYNNNVQEGDESSLEYRIITKSGKQKWVLDKTKRTFYDGLGYMKSFLGAIQDITDKKEFEKEILNLNALLDKAGALARIGIWEISLEKDNALYISNVLFEIFRLKDIEKMPKPEELIELIHPDDKSYVMQIYKNIESVTKIKKIDFRLLFPNDTICYLTARAELEYQDGKLKRVYGFIQDITQQKLVENQLILEKERAQESEKLKNSFLSNITHEIRTPMNGMIGFADMLKNPNLPIEKKTKYIEIIQSSSKQLLKVVSNILDVAKLESETFALEEKPVYLYDFMDEIYDSIISSKLYNNDLEIKVYKGIREEHATVMLDKGRLMQVFENLLANSLKFTTQGAIGFGFTLRSKWELLFFVEDTGIGISKSKQSVIFERFRQVDEGMKRQYGGTGLGLTIVSTILKRMGGDVSIESELGKGATMYFSVPYKPIVNSQKTNNEMQRELILEGKSILLVEDNFISQELISGILLSEGADVMLAVNGKVAREFILNRHFDAILLDSSLPDMSYNIFLHSLATMKIDVPVFLLSSNRALNKSAISNKRIVDIFTKPIKKEILLKAFLDTNVAFKR